MGLVQRTLYAQLPEGVKADKAVLRYVLPRKIQHWGWRQVWTAIVLGLIVICWVALTTNTPLFIRSPRKSAFYNVLYFPLSCLQVLVLLLALLSSSSVVLAEKQHGKWKMLQITSHGIERVIYAQWVAIFLQMRSLLTLLVLLRLILAGLMLSDITAYDGHHLDLYQPEITPEVSLTLVVIMLGAQITSALLQFPVLIGLNAALGLLIAVTFQKRVAAAVTCSIVLAIECVLFGLGWWVQYSAPQYNPTEHMIGRWITLLFGGTFGDQSLALLDVQTCMGIWTAVDYGILLGGVLLVVIVIQLLVTQAMLIMTVTRAQYASPRTLNQKGKKRLPGHNQLGF